MPHLTEIEMSARIIIRGEMSARIITPREEAFDVEDDLANA